MPSVLERPARDPVSGPLLELVDGDSRVILAPQRGALVTSFRVGERELLYLDESTLSDGTKNVRGGIPVLFPSPGKLDGDHFRIGDREGSMKQHGFARNLAWSRAESGDETEASATLSLSSSPTTLQQYPWPFEATLTFQLKRARLRIALRVRNRGDVTLPFAFGLHPYFHVIDKAHATIDTAATRAFDNVQKREVAFYGFDLTGPEVDLHLLDHGSSESALHYGDGSSLQLRASSDLSLWVVWTLAGKDFVCVEPWSSPGNALNTGERLLSIEPNQRHESWVEFEFTA
ncbi:MAG TPA: galactose mutarotase [Polyangiales bacterium]|nr:galactose mutarotase [Polyangiales bacterium]